MKKTFTQTAMFVTLFLLGISCSDKPSGETKKTDPVTMKTLNDFGLTAHNVFLYYNDLEAAAEFYTTVLGLEEVADYGMARTLRVAKDSYFILVDADYGMHQSSEPKTVAIALVTDQLDEWYAFLKEQGYAMKYDYEPKEGSAHDGFVMEDPEGYLLEFERFNPHEKNLQFTPLLDSLETISAVDRDGILTPAGLGFKATVTWLYYKDMVAIQDFYEKQLGLVFLVDQGWAKVYGYNTIIIDVEDDPYAHGFQVI